MEDTKDLGKLFGHLHDWLEDDRDRRSAVLRADNTEMWWLALRIDDRSVSTRSGYDLDEVLSEALAGMIISDPYEGFEVK